MAGEVETITAVDAALVALEDPAARRRVLEWAWNKFIPAHSDLSTSQPRPQANAPQGNAKPESFSSPAQLIRAAKPGTGAQHIIVLAYWLEKFEMKLQWSTSDINDAFDQAKLKRLSNPAKFITDTIRQGLVRSAGEARTLTQTGEREVEQMLAAAKETR